MKKLITLISFLAITLGVLAQSNRATVKTWFETGDVPTEAQYATMINSYLSLADTNIVEKQLYIDSILYLKEFNWASSPPSGYSSFWAYNDTLWFKNPSGTTYNVLTGSAGIQAGDDVTWTGDHIWQGDFEVQSDIIIGGSTDRDFGVEANPAVGDGGDLTIHSGSANLSGTAGSLYLTAGAGQLVGGSVFIYGYDQTTDGSVWLGHSNSVTEIGSVLAITVADSDSTKKVATTAFVKNVISSLGLGAGWDSLNFNTSDGYLRAYLSGAVDDSTSIDGRYVAGSGLTEDYVPVTTATGGLEDSQIRDDGTSLGIGASPYSGRLATLSTGSLETVAGFYQTGTGLTNTGVRIDVSGAGPFNQGLYIAVDGASVSNHALHVSSGRSLFSDIVNIYADKATTLDIDNSYTTGTVVGAAISTDGASTENRTLTLSATNATTNNALYISAGGSYFNDSVTMTTFGTTTGGNFVTELSGVLQKRTASEVRTDLDVVKHDTRDETISIASPDGSIDRVIFYTTQAITVTKIHAVVEGGSSPSVTIKVGWTVERNGALASMVSSWDIDSETSAETATISSNQNIAAGRFVILESSAVSGSPDELAVTVEYTLQ